MSIQAEVLFRTIIVRGLRTIRKDTRLIDQLFRNLPRTIQQEIRKFFLKSAISVDINWPRSGLKLPSIIILLRSEDESQAFLADSLGFGQIPEFFEFDNETDNEEFALLGGVASLSSLSGEGQLVFGPIAVQKATPDTVTIADTAWAYDQFLVQTHEVKIKAGPGAGQIRTIVSNTPNELTVDKPWTTVPTSSSVLEIRTLPGEHVGEPAYLYSSSEENPIERLGNLEAVGYQLLIVTGQAELTVFLHTVIKALFYLSRQFLEEQGLINFKMSATDFINQADFEPDHAYARAMNIDFIQHFDVFNELTDFAKDFRVVLETECDDTSIAEIVSDVTVTN